MRLQFERQLCDGCHGLVLAGKLSNRAAVFKLLGPNHEGMTAYYTELAALRYLSAKAVPAAVRLISASHLSAGVHYLATEFVAGTALSAVHPITPAIADAAVAALRTVHAAHPGFLHGDIRLPNVMLVSGSDAPPECKIIDFGASSFNGCKAKQDQEMLQLQQLLQGMYWFAALNIAVTWSLIFLNLNGNLTMLLFCTRNQQPCSSSRP